MPLERSLSDGGRVVKHKPASVRSRRRWDTLGMFDLRPSSPDDADGVLRVLAARDLADFGDIDYTREELLDQWRLRDFDPAANAALAEDEGRVIGYATLFSPGALAFVDPSFEGLGVGTALLSWTEARARAQGRRMFRQRVGSRNDVAEQLLLGAGYSVGRKIKRMGRRFADAPPAPLLPSGISLSRLDVDRDAEALHEADDRAFGGNRDYEPMSLATFYDEHLASPHLDPNLSRIARRGNKIVGFVVCRRQPPGKGYIDLLAVDRAERSVGLGRALLLSAFEAIAGAGLGEAWLDVASDNPVALRLYGRAGMTPLSESTIFEKPVA
jgi:mycothiol synthase